MGRGDCSSLVAIAGGEDHWWLVSISRPHTPSVAPFPFAFSSGRSEKAIRIPIFRTVSHEPSNTRWRSGCGKVFSSFSSALTFDLTCVVPWVRVRWATDARHDGYRAKTLPSLKQYRVSRVVSDRGCRRIQSKQERQPSADQNLWLLVWHRPHYASSPLAKHYLTRVQRPLVHSAAAMVPCRWRMRRSDG
ncbi:hypothetical protein BO86DRAFT_188088 [Aspergillus japonicus CBS 114.51]|uniref:Uncharacterized protein n=1 Tax=Aspergillus japonicus CBS 114.51 TaxID=1448312 RepID=A0A8T8XB59_ASPJA|nr:hypothetical protein BO86DRAFT_188088 [Aspergillus japonicus CBS 114.51]RAH85298.1 hypothetical protein BO86DRAFT_188088 [Aspergillus japonicus CBS 114.51]